MFSRHPRFPFQERRQVCTTRRLRHSVTSIDLGHYRDSVLAVPSSARRLHVFNVTGTCQPWTQPLRPARGARRIGLAADIHSALAVPSVLIPLPDVGLDALMALENQVRWRHPSCSAPCRQLPYGAGTLNRPRQVGPFSVPGSTPWRWWRSEGRLARSASGSPPSTGMSTFRESRGFVPGVCPTGGHHTLRFGSERLQPRCRLRGHQPGVGGSPRRMELCRRYA